jgi:competence protein ComEC
MFGLARFGALVVKAHTGGWLPPLGASCGSLVAVSFNTVPPGGLLAAAALAGLLLMAPRQLRWAGAMILACSWSLWNFQVRLDDRLSPDLTGTPLTSSGTIVSIPQVYDEFASFRFAPDLRSSGPGLPQTLMVRWYRDWPDLSAGQRWELELVLKPPWGRVNFQGPDKEQWLFAAGIGGLGTVRGGTLLPDGEHGSSLVLETRQAIAREIIARVGNERARGIILALALADRSGISQGDRSVLILTGTAHLLAISGLHIGLAAGGGMLLARGLTALLPFTVLGGRLYLAAAAGGLLTASLYAALAGFGTPTVRSLLMLVVVLTALVTARAVHPLRAWLLALTAVLLLDPFAPLAAGFWFSFLAVAGLLLVFVPRTGRRPWWRSLLMGQAAVLLLLLPVSAAWFQGFSPAGFIANLAAIPWVSFLVVPFVLLGTAALAISGDLAGVLWSAAAGALFPLWRFLEFMAGLQGQLTVLRAPSLTQAALALLGSALLLLPRGLPWRWAGAFLIVPLLLPGARNFDVGEIEVEVLDVGQGTAVLLSTGGRTLLYDSGPGDGAEGNLVASVMAPALQRSAAGAPERVIISHGDLDHAGGMAALQKRYPHADYLANLPDTPDGMATCSTPLQWHWNSVDFEVLHPTASLPYLGNDSSCVLSIRQGNRGILLSGDISATVERRLIREGLAAHEMLLVPHHGSKTSSSDEFVAAVRPRIAVATAGLGNRFGFPRDEIRARYLGAGVSFWSTGDCGAVRLVLGMDGSLRTASARRQRPGIWRWPAAANCP